MDLTEDTCLVRYTDDICLVRYTNDICVIILTSQTALKGSTRDLKAEQMTWGINSLQSDTQIVRKSVILTKMVSKSV